MTDMTTNGATTLDRKIQLLQYHLPALEDGKYDITIEQSISVGGQALAGSPFRSAGQSFVVAGERFALKPSDVYTVFPPEGSLGDHSNVLPHIVLERSTLPWERDAGAGAGVTWLALLLFEESERPEPLVSTLAELKNTSGYPAKFPTSSLQSGQTDDDKVTVIDVKASVLQNILPTGGDLAYLAHVRADGEERAVVVCHRLPVKGGISTVHLVSLEGRYSGDAFDYMTAQGDDLVRLVSLKSWSFACVDDEQSFKGLLAGVDHAPSTLRLPDSGNPAADQYYARGFVPLEHAMRGGEKTVSFYHGPLAPGAHTSDMPLPARAADSLLRFDPSIGMFDVSYAAAWELGRLLALQSKPFSVGLYNWKRANAQRVRQVEQRLLHPHLATAAAAPGSGELPEALSSWLDELSLLKGVPFNYLVPDERMLPKESLRFFQLDRLWVECLLDGAFSVGRVTSSDHARDPSVATMPAAGTATQVTGFMLRSDVVSGWPGLLVDATNAAGGKLKCMRMERLSSNVLICMFAGQVASIAVHKKPEDLHFGVDAPDLEHPQFHKKLRDNWGQEEAIVVEDLPWREQSLRTLHISALAELMRSRLGQTTFTSAHFALEMIEGVDMVVFHEKA